MAMQKSYEQIVPMKDRRLFEEVLQMGSGYVLNFSDRSFQDFVYESVGVDCYEKKHLFEGQRSGSKANRLRTFVERGPSGQVGKLLRDLWEYRQGLNLFGSQAEESRRQEVYFSVIARIESSTDAIDTSAIESFEPNETLEELVSAIKRDLDARKPQAALDRLHVYCMKRFSSLVRKSGGGDLGKEEPLHSRVAKYVKIVKSRRSLTPASEKIIQNSINLFEALNPIRNDKSLAHDNPELVEMEEARFIFDSVAALLRFVKAVDGRNFEG